MPQPKRSYDRATTATRPVTITTNINEYAEGSAMVEFGRTKVLCTASIDDTVAPWLKGKGQGWITAEYGMLPRSTHTRMKRERDKMSGRTHEIQRLVGRALRTCLDLKRIGERTVTIDCDVIQADGGTRTAAITGGYVALALAVRKLGKAQGWAELPLLDQVAAVSVGLKGGQILVDLDYEEDSSCDVDMNFVMTGKGLFVEIQGTAEHQPFSKTDMDNMTHAAMASLLQLHEIQRAVLKEG
ncbi:MAG: ribonuclease PH [Deltaproteobacteria bacterium]|nr:ribonuclease PH [Deltaproteobacteria bacterium]